MVSAMTHATKSRSPYTDLRDTLLEEKARQESEAEEALERERIAQAARREEQRRLARQQVVEERKNHMLQTVDNFRENFIPNPVEECEEWLLFKLNDGTFLHLPVE